MPWYHFIDDEMDPCDPDSYVIVEKAPESEDGPYLHAIFADEVINDPYRRPDLDSTPGLLYYMIRAFKSSKGQPFSISPPVPLEVRMSMQKAKRDNIMGEAENPN